MSRCPSFGIAWRTQNEVMGVVVIHTPFADSGSATHALCNRIVRGDLA
jgi:hypothetical protein